MIIQRRRKKSFHHPNIRQILKKQHKRLSSTPSYKSRTGIGKVSGGAGCTGGIGAKIRSYRDDQWGAAEVGGTSEYWDDDGGREGLTNSRDWNQFRVIRPPTTAPMVNIVPSPNESTIVNYSSIHVRGDNLLERVLYAVFHRIDTIFFAVAIPFLWSLSLSLKLFVHSVLRRTTLQ